MYHLKITRKSREKAFDLQTRTRTKKPLASTGSATSPPGPNRRRRLPPPPQITVTTVADTDGLDCRGDAVRRQAVHSMKGRKNAVTTALVFNCQVCKAALDSQTPYEIKRKIMQKLRKEGLTLRNFHRICRQQSCKNSATSSPAKQE